jgi:hypothetical protein
LTGKNEIAKIIWLKELESRKDQSERNKDKWLGRIYAGCAAIALIYCIIVLQPLHTVAIAT